MQIYWTLKGIPELSGLSRQERGSRWRMAVRKTFRHWQIWLAIAAFAACIWLATYFGGLIDMDALGAALGGGAGGFMFSQVTNAVARKYYRHILLGEPPEQEDVSKA